MNLEKLDRNALKVEPVIAEMIGFMDEHEKYRTKELMFSLIPVMLKIASEDDDFDKEAIVSTALDFAVLGMTHATLAGL